MALKIYLKEPEGYQEIPSEDILTVNLPEPAEHEAVLEAVTETLDSKLVIIKDLEEDSNGD